MHSCMSALAATSRLLTHILGLGRRRAYGAVYKAQHKETGIELAIKVINPDLSRTSVTEDIRKEIDILKKVGFGWLAGRRTLYRVPCALSHTRIFAQTLVV